MSLQVSSGASFSRGDACVAPTHVSANVAPWSWGGCTTRPGFRTGPSMHYPHVTPRQADCTRSPWRGLPVCVQASSPSQAGAGRGCWCASTNFVQHNRLRAGIAYMPDRLDDWHEHIQHLRDQDGERYATRRIVSAAAAAAWLPHATCRDTGNSAGQPYSPRRVQRKCRSPGL